MKKIIYIGADHAGFARKEFLKKALEEQGFSVVDFGAKSLDEKDDYPDYAYPLAEAVAKDGYKGVLLCGNAEGVCIVANKVDGVRAALGYSVEAVISSREDDDTNVLCLPGREFTDEDALEMFLAWEKTDFSGAERHKRRLEKINKIEQDN